MIIERTDDERGDTEILIYPSDEYRDRWRMAHRVYCRAFDISGEQQGPLFAQRRAPRATISPLGLHSPCKVADLQRHGAELLTVAGVALALEEEKRAAYFARWPDDPEAPKREPAGEPEDEPQVDYDELRRAEQRKQRAGKRDEP